MMDRGGLRQMAQRPRKMLQQGKQPCLSKNTNGTGAFMLISRVPDQKTVLKANPNYWGKGQFPLEVSEIIYTPVQSAATRIAALLSGEVDFIQDVPVQDLGRVDQDGLKVVTAAQNRVIFFGMNSGKADLETDNVNGRNPCRCSSPSRDEYRN